MERDHVAVVLLLLLLLMNESTSGMFGIGLSIRYTSDFYCVDYFHFFFCAVQIISCINIFY